MNSALYRRCARLLMVGFPKPQMDSELTQLMDAGIFGAILFKRNMASAEENIELCRQLKTHARRPFCLAVDQEGGRVARLRGAPYTNLPPMRKFGEKSDTSTIERAGKLLAFELRATGFDWNFAPVLDVDTNPQNPVIGDRSFSRDVDTVSRAAIALARGLELGQVASCGKHFPGHGDTLQDSHAELPHLPHSLERLRSIEWAPFRAYAQAGLASVMTAHVIFDALDAGVPATMSAKLLQDFLRKEIGFQGVIVSDDLEMKAITEHYSIEEAAVNSVIAGADLLLVCHQPEKQNAAIEALVKAVESGKLSSARLDEAHARLDVLQKRFVHAPEDAQPTFGAPEHLALAQGLDSDFFGSDPTEYKA